MDIDALIQELENPDGEDSERLSSPTDQEVLSPPGVRAEDKQHYSQRY